MFYRTYGSDAGTADPATVSAFRLDKYLVTVGRFRQFVAAFNGADGGAGWMPAAGSGKHTFLNGGKGLADAASPGMYETGWNANDDTTLSLSNGDLDCDPGYAAWTRTPGSHENLPINCVNWFEAYAFCIWDGGFLPSENEFEYAAAGGNRQLEFPWGSTDPGMANQYAIYNCDYHSGDAGCTGVTNIAPVGTANLGAGLWGQLDLVGEVQVWLLDWNSFPYVDPCSDCAYLTHGSGREVRGASFQSSSTTNLMSAYRNEGLYPVNRSNTYGFRCAKAP